MKAAWKKKDDERKKFNDAILAPWNEKVKEWEEERDLAKLEKRPRRWLKPQRPTDELLPSIPKPWGKKGAIVEADGQVDGEMGGDGETGGGDEVTDQAGGDAGAEDVEEEAGEVSEREEDDSASESD